MMFRLTLMFSCGPCSLLPTDALLNSDLLRLNVTSAVNVSVRTFSVLGMPTKQ